MYLMLAAVNLALAVMLGAFGTHGIKSIASLEQLNWWQTATQYFFYHALGLLILGCAMRGFPALSLKAPFWCLQIGILIFCGSLYVMALGAPRWFGAITPIGGLMLIAGWLLLAWQTYLTR